jgi:polyhydroxybutyrate depolymerase
MGLLCALAVATLATSCSSASGTGAATAPPSSCRGRAPSSVTVHNASLRASRLPTGTPVLRTTSVRVDGRTRTYLVAAPASASRSPVPLIVLFHGSGVDADYIAHLTELPERGVDRGVLVAIPNSRGGSWESDPGGPDGHLVDAMLASLELRYCVDETRVSLVGLSSGAVFAIRYACRHAGEVAAVATVAAEYQLGCTHPLSILAFHGTEDPTVPYAGAPGDAVPGLRATGTLANMAAWARLDGCGETPMTIRVASQVERRSWPSCSAGNEVVLYTIVGGGHTWPDADQAPRYGMTTHQLDATSASLDFLARHAT